MTPFISLVITVCLDGIDVRDPVGGGWVLLAGWPEVLDMLSSFDALRVRAAP